MITIGLTGGSGSGKGCVCQIFSSYGIDSIDTDIVSRNVCSKGSECLNELCLYFGNSILFDDGNLNRKYLASIAFSDSDKLSALNRITHKHILSNVRKWLQLQESEKKIAAIVDAPVLFESGFDSECDIVISVIADKETRIKRITDRDKISYKDAELRLSRQKNDEFYIRHSDYVIKNNGTLEDMANQVKSIYNSIITGEKYDT